MEDENFGIECNKQEYNLSTNFGSRPTATTATTDTCAGVCVCV